MNAMRAAVLPEPRAGQYLEADAGNGTRSRPDLRLVHCADLAVAALPAAALATPLTQRPAPPLRLTRRGRIVVAVMAALLVAALSLIAAGAAQAISHTGPAHPAGSANLAQVVVQPGQSLWSVAESADPNADTRLVIQQITELNSLNGDTVFAGQRLWVPRG
jgi:LysM domain-containing protein